MKDVTLTEGDVTVTNNLKDVSQAIIKAWEWWTNPKVRQYMMSDILPDNRQDFTAALVNSLKPVLMQAKELQPEQNPVPFFAVKHGDDVMGMILIINGGFEIATDQKGWKQGKALVASRLVIEYVFSILNIDRLNASYPKGNKVARKFLEKLGFRYEGTRRNGMRYGGEPVDICQVGILREDVEDWHKEPDKVAEPQVDEEFSQQPEHRELPEETPAASSPA